MPADKSDTSLHQTSCSALLINPNPAMCSPSQFCETWFNSWYPTLQIVCSCWRVYCSFVSSLPLSLSSRTSEGQSLCFHPRLQILICRCATFPAGITDFIPITENTNVIVSSVLVNPHFLFCSDDKVFVEKHSAELIRITSSCLDSFALAAGQRPNLPVFFLQPV